MKHLKLAVHIVALNLRVLVSLLHIMYKLINCFLITTVIAKAKLLIPKSEVDVT